VIVLFLAVASGTLTVGVAVAIALQLLPTVRLQLSGLALMAVLLPLAAVSLSGLAMFHGGAARAVLVVSATSAVAALVGAWLVERSIVGRLQRLRTTSATLAGGDFGARAPVGGPAELAELASSFNMMARNLEELFDARQELVTWASHDLRAPVTSLKAMLEAIEDGLVAPAEYMGALQGQVRLMEGLVSELFESVRVDTGAARLEFESTELGALAQSCAARFEAEARTAGVRISVERSEPQARARCAPTRVERVLSNLITNALHHTPPGGWIVVSVVSSEGEVQVAVTDSGCGIPAAALERAFEPFWRADPARSPAAGGAGLGLAISKSLIEAQGGRIWAERPASGGTRVCFGLPMEISNDRARLASAPSWRPRAATPVLTEPITPGSGRGDAA
jgi:two-component system sensor histidine kinase BaeS